MKSLDIYIQEKREAFRKLQREHVLMTGDYQLDFIEEIVRTTARETLEAVLPEEHKCIDSETRWHKIRYSGYNEAIDETFSAAKERGIIN